MRIVAGEYGGRALITPKNREVRPTSDKIRGAIFNMLHSRGCVEGVDALDAFCGTGALGLEALSRGAAHCTFLDKSRVSLDLAKENAANLEAMDLCEFKLRDATILRDTKKPYELIFLDPPYFKGLAPVALERMAQHGWIEKGAWIVCETEKKCDDDFPTHFEIDVQKTYSDIKVTILRYDA